MTKITQQVSKAITIGDLVTLEELGAKVNTYRAPINLSLTLYISNLLDMNAQDLEGSTLAKPLKDLLFSLIANNEQVLTLL